jgi:hypothetical protein
VGGELVVEGDVLWFRPSALERRLHNTDWSIPLSDVTGFRVAPVSPLSAFAGGLRPRLALDVGRGTTHLFIVPAPAKVAKELLALAVEPADGAFPGDGPLR